MDVIRVSSAGNEAWIGPVDYITKLQTHTDYFKASISAKDTLGKTGRWRLR